MSDTAQVLFSAENYSPDDSPAYLMGSVLSLMRGALDEELNPHCEVTGAQWVMLMLLSRGKCTTAREMARRLDYDSGSMTRMLDRLETKGLIKRVRDGQDRRVIRLELSDEGQKLAPRLPLIGVTVLNQFLRGFSVEEVEQLKSFLRRMIANAARDETTETNGGRST
jgi:DNA-binding MarR family transcriptional regulator